VPIKFAASKLLLWNFSFGKNKKPMESLEAANNKVLNYSSGLLKTSLNNSEV